MMKRHTRKVRWLAVALLVSAVVMQIWVVYSIQKHLPQAVAFDDTRLLEEGWDAAVDYAEGTDVGLCTMAIDLSVQAGNIETKLPFCHANGAFSEANALDLVEGGFWDDGEVAKAVVLPQAIADILDLTLGDSLTVDGTACTVKGIYRPWHLPGTPEMPAPVYGNFLSMEQEAAQTTLQVVVPLPGDTQESARLYNLFKEQNLGPYGRSINLKNWSQLVGQLLWLELLLVLLVPALCLTARGVATLCRLILPSPGKSPMPRWSWAYAALLSLVPVTVWSLLLAQVQIPGEFLPDTNLFDFDRYAQIAQGVTMFAAGSFGFSPATAQYLDALRLVALLAVPVMALGWLLTVPAACGWRKSVPCTMGKTNHNILDINS